MKGADEYMDLFEMADQYGGLYVVPYRDVINGDSLSVYVLPPNTHATFGGKDKPPKNKDIVLVYGPLKDEFGWLDECGWLHHGDWEEDFYNLVSDLRKKKEAREMLHDARERAKIKLAKQRQQKILDSY